jgi:hypothetical protein
MLSLFVHVTVVPTVVVIEEGEKAMPEIFTEFVATGLILADIALFFLEQETNIVAINKMITGVPSLDLLAAPIFPFSSNEFPIFFINKFLYAG